MTQKKTQKPNQQKNPQKTQTDRHFSGAVKECEESVERRVIFFSLSPHCNVIQGCEAATEEPSDLPFSFSVRLCLCNLILNTLCYIFTVGELPDI